MAMRATKKRTYRVLTQPEWGQMLKKERLAACMSQERLMFATQIRQIAISRWENAKRDIPAANVISQLEDGLGIMDGRLMLSGGRLHAGQLIEIEVDDDDPDRVPIIHGMSRAA